MNRLTIKIVIIFTLLILINLLPADSILVLIIRLCFLVCMLILLAIIITGLLSQIKFTARPYPTVQYNHIAVSFQWRLQGGGIIVAHEFVRIVFEKIGKVGHVFEYCAGPGFIGFALLANDLCDHLTLADVNPKAVAIIKETIRNNNLQDKVSVYQSDCLESIPDHEQWDLVVGNPPWNLAAKSKTELLLNDPQGRVHEHFYRDVGKHLKEDATVLFVEGGEYTKPDLFKAMIENNGFQMMEAFRPAFFERISKNSKEYRGLNLPFIITMQFLMFFRETYFIHTKRVNP